MVGALTYYQEGRGPRRLTQPLVVRENMERGLSPRAKTRARSLGRRKGKRTKERGGKSQRDIRVEMGKKRAESGDGKKHTHGEIGSGRSGAVQTKARVRDTRRGGRIRSDGAG